MIKRVSKRFWRAYGGLANPKCSRKMIGPRWFYYYDFS